MAWERRGNRMYYYRGVRIAGKVRKLYFGKGRAADLAALASETAKPPPTLASERRRLASQPYGQASRIVESLSDCLDIVAKAAFIANGCYKHGGEWRRRKNT